MLVLLACLVSAHLALGKNSVVDIETWFERTALLGTFGFDYTPDVSLNTTYDSIRSSDEVLIDPATNEHVDLRSDTRSLAITRLSVQKLPDDVCADLQELAANGGSFSDVAWNVPSVPCPAVFVDSSMVLFGHAHDNVTDSDSEQGVHERQNAVRIFMWGLGHVTDDNTLEVSLWNDAKRGAYGTRGLNFSVSSPSLNKTVNWHPTETEVSKDARVAAAYSSRIPLSHCVARAHLRVDLGSDVTESVATVRMTMPECLQQHNKDDAESHTVVSRMTLAYLGSVFSAATTYALLALVLSVNATIGITNFMTTLSQSQSRAQRSSFLSLSWHCGMDAMLCMAHASLALLLAESLFAVFLIVALFNFICFAVCHMRLLLTCYQAQHPDVSPAAALGTVQSRFYGGLLVTLVVVALTQPYAPVVATLLSSFWVPQIVHAIRHNTTHGVTRRYVYSTTLLRLMPPLYFWAYPRNFLSLIVRHEAADAALQPHSRPTTALVIFIWVCVQLAWMELQRYKGPRFLLQRFSCTRKLLSATGAAPVAHDYTSSTEVPRRATCAICLDRVLGGSTDGAGTNDGDSDDDSDAELEAEYELHEPGYISTAQDDIAHTPCRHFFHAHCLRQWMQVQMRCPSCRAALPADLADAQGSGPVEFTEDIAPVRWWSNWRQGRRTGSNRQVENGVRVNNDPDDIELDDQSDDRDRLLPPV